MNLETFFRFWKLFNGLFPSKSETWQGKKLCEYFCKQNHVMAVMLHMVGIFAKWLENDIPTFLFQDRKQVFLSA